MILKPLSDHERVRLLLEVVPATFRDEVRKTLRLIQFSAWLVGFDAGQYSTYTRDFPPEPKRADEHTIERILDGIEP